MRDDRGVRAHRRAGGRRGRPWPAVRRRSARRSSRRCSATRPSGRWPRTPARTCTGGWRSCSRASAAGSPTGWTPWPVERGRGPALRAAVQDVEDTRMSHRIRLRGRHRRADLPSMLDGARRGDRGRWTAGADPRLPARARVGARRAGERLRLSGEHTVVALAGSTGSGKSSLFNALAGRGPLARGRPAADDRHRRMPASGVWRARRRSSSGSACRAGRPRGSTALGARRAGRDLDGLVLLDLPDHDSTAVDHRLEVDRLVELVDLLVWVVDPQKYADEALHERYLRRLAGHDAVTVVVLNQVDTINPFAAAECADDLRRLLDDDGLRRAPVLTTSARTGAGLDGAARAARRRGGQAPGPQRPAGGRRRGRRRRAVALGVGRGADRGRRRRAWPAGRGAGRPRPGVPVIGEAVERVVAAARRRAARLAARPLAAPAAARPAAAAAPRRGERQREVRGAGALLGARAHAGAAGAGRHGRARGLATRVAADLPRAVAATPCAGAAVGRPGDVRDAPRRRRWSAPTSASTGSRCGGGPAPRGPVAAHRGRRGRRGSGCWLLAFGSYLRLPDPATPDVARLRAADAAAGRRRAARAAARRGRPVARPRAGARTRRRRAESRLRAGIEEVADELMLGPVEAELARHARARDALESARRRLTSRRPSTVDRVSRRVVHRSAADVLPASHRAGHPRPVAATRPPSGDRGGRDERDAGDGGGHRRVASRRAGDVGGACGWPASGWRRPSGASTRGCHAWRTATPSSTR